MLLPAQFLGDLPLIQSSTACDLDIRLFEQLTASDIDTDVCVRAKAAAVRGKGKCAFFIGSTAVC
jgi:hypothetical protein